MSQPIDHTNLEEDSSFDLGKYSPELDSFLRKPSNSVELSKFTPVYCIGLSRLDVHTMRNSYMSYQEEFDVKVYGFYNNHNIIPRRVGITPRVIVVHEVRLIGELRWYIMKNRIPVLRIQERRCPLVDLPNEDYYAGVYETLSYSDITNSKLVTSMLDLGIRIYNRNRGDNTQMSEFTKQTLKEVLEIPETVANAELLLKHLFS